MPAWNEQQSIGAVLEEIGHLYPHLDVLVVDDGSHDLTAQIAREKGAQVVSHGRNLGVAAAIQTGRVYALSRGYHFIVFCDADGQHNPADIGLTLTPLIEREADFVIGSRELGGYLGKESPLLRLSRRFCSLAISLLTHKRITDPTSGFKSWNRTVIEYFNVIYETSNKLHLGTTNDMEEILLADRKGFRITEVPARMRYRRGGVSKVYTTETLLHFLTVFPLNLIRTVLRNLR